MGWRHLCQSLENSLRPVTIPAHHHRPDDAGGRVGQRALSGIAPGGRAWLFAGSDCGGERAAAMHTLIAAARLNDINPQTWLADVLAHIADPPASRLHELLPWNWKANQDQSCRRLITGPPRSLAAGYGSLHAGLLAASAAGVWRREQQRRKPVRDGSEFLALAIDLPGV